MDRGKHDWIVAHRPLLPGFFVATCPQADACRRFLVGSAKRQDYTALDLEELAEFQPPERWLMGYLHCADDELQAFLDWVASCPESDQDRIIIFVHHTLDSDVIDSLVDAMGLSCRVQPTRAVDPSHDKVAFGHDWGNAHNNAILKEFPYLAQE